MNRFATSLALALFVSAGSSQVVPPNEAGVSMGHLHLTSKDPDVQKKFWMDVVGARPAKLGALDVLEIPGTIIFIDKGEPGGGTAGSVINHVGVKVRDLQVMLAKVKASGIKIVTRNEKQAMLLIPDDIRLELTSDPAMTEPVENHHIHFYTADVEATRKWYAEIFGAIPGQRGPFQAADLPGVNLSFSKSDTAVAGTKGRSLDHIGFEVKNLEPFTKRLQQRGIKFSVHYRKVQDSELLSLSSPTLGALTSNSPKA